MKNNDRDYRMKASPCPGCGENQDGAFGPDADRAPEPGDFSICLKCQGLYVFGDDKRLRELTEAEILELPLDLVSRYQRALTKAKEAIK